MKTSVLFILAASLLTTSAFAAHFVGDRVRFEGTYTEEGVSVPASLQQTLKKIDANSNVYSVESVQTIGSESRTQVENVSADDLVSESASAGIVEKCDAGIGKRESITVKAGTFDSCHAKNGNGSQVWMAVVPFGIARVEQLNSRGGKLILELASIVRGQ